MLLRRHELRYIEWVGCSRTVGGLAGHYVRKDGMVQTAVENVSEDVLVTPDETGISNARWFH